MLRTPLSFLYTFYVKIQSFIFLPVRFGSSTFLFGKLNMTSLCCFLSSIVNNSLLVRSLFWRVRPVDSTQEIENYCNYFNNKYGIQNIPFYRGSLNQVFSITNFKITSTAGRLPQARPDRWTD